MKTAQLVKKETIILYVENGIVLSLNANQKLAHTILGKETKTITTEEVVMRFRGKNRNELESQFWFYMETEKLDSSNYSLIIDSY